MRKIFLAALLAIGTTICVTQQATAQVNVNINIGNQPAWGPVGYDYAQYYYMPEYDIYYDVMTNRYIYMNNRRWIHAAMLPPHLRNINLFNTYKVVLNQHNPYRYNNRHRNDYRHFRNDRNQMALRDHRGHQQQHRPAVQQPRHRNQIAGPRQQPPMQQHRPMQKQQRPAQHRSDRVAQNQRPQFGQQQDRRGPQNDRRDHQQRPQRDQREHGGGPRR